MTQFKVGDRVIITAIDPDGNFVQSDVVTIHAVYSRSGELSFVTDSYDVVHDDGLVVENILPDNLMRLQ